MKTPQLYNHPTPLSETDEFAASKNELSEIIAERLKSQAESLTQRKLYCHEVNGKMIVAASQQAAERKYNRNFAKAA